MKNINDLQIGVAGEYLTCADLILNGYVAFLSEQGLPYDVVFDVSGKLYKVQVKTTRSSRNIPQRKTKIPAFIFHIGRNGRGGCRKKYAENQVDIFALVDLESRGIAYLPYFNTKSTMNFRVPKYRGSYHDEQGLKNKNKVINLKNKGKSIDEIVSITGLSKSNVYRYSANVSIEQVGTNSGVYFDEFTLDKCLEKISAI